MMKRGLVVFCCLMLASACAPRRPDPGDARLPATQRPYTVLGKRYKPLRTHEGYTQNGIASWYGSDFHGKSTSNGEKYDMYAMTAAHKTLPLGVYVKVSNRQNGRTAIVRVNDRGPFVKDRIIDLSYTAAHKLGLDAAGTAPVRVEALGYQVPGSDGYKPSEDYDAGGYTIQVGAFKDPMRARRFSDEMRRQYGFSEVRMTMVNGETFYRVCAGKYPSLTAAEEAERDVTERYPGSFVVALE